MSYSNYYLPSSKPSNQGFAKLGLKEIKGFNSGSLLGYSHITDAIDPAAAVRSFSETSFLQKALQDVKNTLTVCKQTLALKVLFNGQQATGVGVRTAGVDYTISAMKEVILAAGSVCLPEEPRRVVNMSLSADQHKFPAPQLLLVSGVGPKNTLQKFNIPLVAELPGVGQDRSDQPNFGLPYSTNLDIFSSFGNTEFVYKAKEAYLTSQNGILANPGGDIFGWEKVPQKICKEFLILRKVRAEQIPFRLAW